MNFLDLLTSSLMKRPPQTGGPDMRQLVPLLEQALQPLNLQSGLGDTPQSRPPEPEQPQPAPGLQDNPYAPLVQRLMAARAPRDPVGGFVDPNVQFRAMAEPFTQMTGGPIQWLGGLPGNLAEHYDKMAGVSAINNVVTALANEFGDKKDEQIDPMAAQLLMMILAGGGR